jgi:hypothetical protein
MPRKIREVTVLGGEVPLTRKSGKPRQLPISSTFEVVTDNTGKRKANAAKEGIQQEDDQQEHSRGSKTRKKQKAGRRNRNGNSTHSG